MTGQQRDLAPERRGRLRDIVREQGVVRVDELVDLLGVSPATVRRDLEELETAGRIRRVHGGAVSVESRLDEPLFDDKTSIAAREKRHIAQKALSFIESEQTVYLDGGSTVLELARLLADRGDLIVVTNSLRAAVELSGRGPRLILIGGELRRRSQTMVGALTRKTIEELHLDLAFMGTMGLSLEEGMTTTDPSEAFTKQLVMQHAQRSILLADSGKIGKVSFARAGDLRALDSLITDAELDPVFEREAAETGIRIIKT